MYKRFAEHSVYPNRFMREFQFISRMKIYMRGHTMKRTGLYIWWKINQLISLNFARVKLENWHSLAAPVVHFPNIIVQDRIVNAKKREPATLQSTERLQASVPTSDKNVSKADYNSPPAPTVAYFHLCACTRKASICARSHPRYVWVGSYLHAGS